METLDKISRGEGGIRTPGTGYPVRQFSKLLVSATHPPLLRLCPHCALRTSTRNPSAKVMLHREFAKWAICRMALRSSHGASHGQRFPAVLPCRGGIAGNHTHRAVPMALVVVLRRLKVCLRMQARGARLRRFLAAVQEAAVAALPYDFLIALEEVASLDAGE